MTDLKVLEPLFTEGKEKEFLRLLLETNLVRYDWGKDLCWVWPGDGKDPGPNDAIWMYGEEFHARLYDAGLQKNWMAAGFIVDLLINGIDVQIAVDELFSTEYMDQLVEYAIAGQPEGKIGTLMQFVPKKDVE